MMDKALVAQKSPYQVDVEAGRSYFWCACGRSAKQPFCDGSHKGSAFVPQLFKAEESASIWLCGCKQTKSSPMCDGTHQTL